MELDDVGHLILTELSENARMSWSELGRRVGLSAPAVAERVRRLEETGVITGYRVDIDPAALGVALLAIIRVHSAGARARDVDAYAATVPEVVDCHRVTGSESHVLRVQVRDMGHLNELVEDLWEFGDTITNVVTTTPVQRRAPLAVRSPPPT